MIAVVADLPPPHTAASAVEDAADLETQPPSDTDTIPDLQYRLGNTEQDLLQKMEAINKANEQDSRSVSGAGSRRSNGSTESHSRCSASEAGTGATPGPQLMDESEDLWTLWGNLVKNWETEFKKRPQHIRELVRQGIPCHFRTIAWQLLSNANVPAIHEVYAEYMRSHSPHEKVIKRDISRTYPEHEFFREANGRGQLSLFNVMKAYSLHDREVGYCQGSAFIAGLLLLQMPEEEAFAVLLRLMEEFRLRELYKPAMTELGLCMFQLECLVHEQLADLNMHFQNMGFDTSMYASSWFLTMFTTQLPLELSNRIMDVFISEGMDIVFRVALAILQLSRVDLLQLDMEGMLRYFQRELAQKFDQDHDLLLNTAYNVKLNVKKMKKLEKDYLAKRTKEQEEAVELRRLRTENRLLRQRVDYLEQESAALADRLIQRQVSLAQEAENSVNIKHEMFSLREMNNEAHRRLEDAYETIRELTSKVRDGVGDAEVQVDDRSMIEHIHTLQQEVMEIRIREADHEGIIRDLKTRIHELETANKRLKETPPDHCVATLQEELIAVKMREAEANLSLKEMRQKIADLHVHWETFVAAAQQAVNDESSSAPDKKSKKEASNGSTSSSMTFKELQDQLMGVRIREADTMAELKEMRQRVMELETQNHVCTNQLRRQDEELKKLMGDCDQWMVKEREMMAQLREEQHKQSDAETKLKEQGVLAKLREAELLETVTDLKNKIAELESKQFEKWTREELSKNSIHEKSFDDGDMVSSPTSLTGSVHMDAMSLENDAEFAAIMAEMAVKIPSSTENTVSNGDAKIPITTESAVGNGEQNGEKPLNGAVDEKAKAGT